MLEAIDPFRLKELSDYLNFLREEVGDLRQDLRFLRALRRPFLPLPLVDRRPRVSAAEIFPPLQVKPHPRLAGKRIGLVTSGGSGGQVVLCGVKRALEEAGIAVAAVSACSGSAIWASMIAAGFSAQQMAELTLSLRARDLADLDWPGLLRLPLTLGKGFAGFVRGEAVEQTLDRAFGGVELGRTSIPYYAILLNIDTNTVEYFGPHSHPGEKLARMVRASISLPLFVHPVRFGDHWYVDGGVVDIFPVEPLLRYEPPFDRLLGVNVIMPSGFQGEDISGWLERPGSILAASRQLYRAQWLQLARLQVERARGRMVLLEPIPWTEIAGSKFYEVFIDPQRWPELMRRGYEMTKKQLETI